MSKFLTFALAWTAWAFCELAFKTDMRGTAWAYRLGNRLYARAYPAE